MLFTGNEWIFANIDFVLDGDCQDFADHADEKASSSNRWRGRLIHFIAIRNEVNVRFVCKSNRCLPASSKASLINITAFIPPAFRGPNPVGVSINALPFL